MGKLLTILGANEEVQQLLPADLFQAEKVIIGLQEIYSQAPDSPKKNQLAIAISEAVRIMMARLNPYLVKDEVEEKTDLETTQSVVPYIKRHRCKGDNKGTNEEEGVRDSDFTEKLIHS